MSCLLCTKTGLALFIIGLSLILFSSLYDPLVFIGLTVVLAAYIVPPIIGRVTRDDEECVSCENTMKGEG